MVYIAKCCLVNAVRCKLTAARTMCGHQKHFLVLTLHFNIWAAWYHTWLLMKLTPNGVVLSSIFFLTFQQLLSWTIVWLCVGGVLTTLLMLKSPLTACLHNQGGMALKAVAQAQLNWHLTHWLRVEVMLCHSRYIHHHPYGMLRLKRHRWSCSVTTLFAVVLHESTAPETTTYMV